MPSPTPTPIPTPAPPDFLFDIGNVILKFDFAIAHRRFQNLSRLPPNLFPPASSLEELKIQLEAGRIDDNSFIQQACEHLRFTGSRDEFVRIWCEIFEENTPMSALIRHLAANGHRLFLLSNTSGIHTDYFLRAYHVFTCFLDGIFSHSARALKPEEKIYRIALDSFKLIPENTIYIDDHPENVAAGKQLGLRSFLYHPDQHDAFLHRLAEAGIGLP